ncbi:MAG: Ig-like domain-containing protein [Xenococcaceae cyanobacterium MO_234.B1]|nr:Ig-like domain-containing protein [Xenococcaceae cyanobacterium MO_234.B1]
MFKFINFKKLTANSLIGLLLAVGLIVESSNKSAVATTGCALPETSDINSGDFPQGATSYGDEIVSFTEGTGNSNYTNSIYKNPQTALGEPSLWDGGGVASGWTNDKGVALGQGGEIVIKFTDNYLTVSGDECADLWIFEIGGAVEATTVEVSKDGVNWENLGQVEGATSGIDLDALGYDSTDLFSYVRLTDDPNITNGLGRKSGADIDAVGAISSINTTAVPYAVNDSTTTDKDTATTTLNVLSNDVASTVLTVSKVEGYATNVGQEITLNSGALVTLNSNGSLTYNPNGQFENLNDGDSTTDTFTYSIVGYDNQPSTATVTINIQGISTNYCSTSDSTSSYDSIDVSIENPGVQREQLSEPLFEINFNDVSGTDGFTKTNGSVTYTYEGSLNVRDANQWGGANGTKYITNHGTQSNCYRVTVNQDQQFFGFWWSAGDSYNKLTFKNNGTEVATFLTSDLKSFIDGSNVNNTSEYYGNPNNTSENPGEPYAFVNIFFDVGIAYDEVVFETTHPQGHARFESDNHTFSATEQLFQGIRISNEPPEANDDYAETEITTEVTIDALANDTDDPDLELNRDTFITEELSITAIDGLDVEVGTDISVAGGTATIDENGMMVYTAGNITGTYTLEYTLSDKYGETDTATVTIEVTPFID